MNFENNVRRRMAFLGLVWCLASASASAALTSRDIGSPTLLGSTTEAGGKIILVGGGTDIWGAADSFHFAWTDVTNDFDYKVRLEDLQGPDNWSKAELMARESTDFGFGMEPAASDRLLSNMGTRTNGQNEVGLQWRSDVPGGGSA